MNKNKLDSPVRKLENKVIEFIEKNELLKKTDSVILGISGGADSVSMLKIFSDIRDRYELKLTVVHVNHNIRKEAIEDQTFVQELCRKLKVDFIVKNIDIKKMVKDLKLSEEEAGRKARYDAFYDTAIKLKANKIAVAHNGDDNAETILFNMFRGSGLSGMTGIAPKRKFRGLEIIRPILCLNREEVEEYVDACHMTYCTDKTNLETVYSRNKIRLKLIPYVEENINANARENIRNLAQHLREVENFLESEAKVAYEKFVRDNTILKEGFLLDDAVFKKLLLMVIHNVDGYVFDLTNAQIEAVSKLRFNQVSKSLNLTKNIVVTRTYEGIKFSKGNLECETVDKEVIDLRLLETEKKIIVSDISFQLLDRSEVDEQEFSAHKTCTKYLDYGKIHTLALRARQPKDYLFIDSEHKQSLKKYFVNNKIDSVARNSTRLLCDENHVIWVLGYRISAYYKVDENTKKILKIEIDKSN